MTTENEKMKIPSVVQHFVAVTELGRVPGAQEAPEEPEVQLQFWLIPSSTVPYRALKKPTKIRVIPTDKRCIKARQKFL